jgi:hypothetical protein
VEKIFLTEDAGTIRAQSMGMTALQAQSANARYIGKWLRVTGYILVVTKLSEFLPDVTVTISDSPNEIWGIYLDFPGDFERLQVANLGDVLKAEGRVCEVTTGLISLDQCKVLSIEAPPPPSPSAPEPPKQEKIASPKGDEQRISTLSKIEAEKFCRAILAGWPDTTEENAHAKSLLFFPDKKVPRDWFRPIFRAIRGPKKRGPAAKSAN